MLPVLQLLEQGRPAPAHRIRMQRQQAPRQARQLTQLRAVPMHQRHRREVVACRLRPLPPTGPALDRRHRMLHPAALRRQGLPMPPGRGAGSRSLAALERLEADR